MAWSSKKRDLEVQGKEELAVTKDATDLLLCRGKEQTCEKSLLKLKDSKLILSYFSKTSKIQQGKLYNGIGYSEGV